MLQITYLLGAGFSAPLGLPVMGNFLERAKDQYYADRDRFANFASILDTIKDMHVANSYYRTDLFNIEEILSILEMQDQISPSWPSINLGRFTQFITDVIKHYTPTPIHRNESQNDWLSHLFWDRPWAEYGPFVASLLGCEFIAETVDPSSGVATYRVEIPQSPVVRYSVVTLNYDLVLETAAALLKKRFRQTCGFSRAQGEPGVPLAKLHGSVDAGDIVPPTWSKGLGSQSANVAWRYAYQALRDANEIRIIGYSLPESDNYVRYLLRAAAMDAPNLKQIHALCLDPDGSVRARYEQFVVYRRFQFQEISTEAYLGRIANNQGQWPKRFSADHLEQAHYSLFKR